MALKGQQRSFLGINIGQATTSVVELIDRGTRVELATYALADTPADLRNALATNNTTSIIQLARFVSSVLEQAAVSSDAVVFSLSSTQIFSTTIELPVIPDKELSAAIFFKAQELIPTELEEMVVTATRPGETLHNVPLAISSKKCQVVLSEAKGVAGNQIRVKENSTTQFLINAIPADTINWYTQLANALNLELVAVEAPVFSIMRIHPVVGPGSVIFANIDKAETDLYIVDRQTTYISRTIDLASTVNAPNILVAEINRIANKHVEKGGRQPARIFLLGPGAMSADFKKTISSAFTIPVNVSNPFAGLSYPRGVEQSLTQKGPLFTVAVGLAASQLNKL
jgi:hypothetical protein